AAAGESFESQLPDGSVGAVWNGVLVALASRGWDAVDRVREVAGLAGADGSRLVVFGGGSRSLPWLEAKASARPDIEVWRSGAVEAVARGAAVYAGVAAGWWSAPDDGPRPPLERVADR
ncbi:MAG: hypothetical protein QOE15_2003, partial [Acidimicrobiaceae bacterium]|nr:hypothetical protein [Acidimicrobiaceae bacterium]